MRVGFGYDSHRLEYGRRLIIGGIEIPFKKGLVGHSDGDVLLHSIIDAIIGALGLGDIGTHFPDTDDRWKSASSLSLLKGIVGLANANGYEVLWVDSTVIAEEPKLAPYIDKMKDSISTTGIPAGSINIKAKTNEKMGFVGRGEGIVSYAVCLLKRF
ncbi:MAG: 2-C-methyl-D-erythritol 2,4-cyclodiphosphate synthase [Nitrospirae bacterium]|nr:2-C-methyl-D-erythritol 2,4-cyclodiphosphate synthase [Nitrospirota bacterium]